MQKFSTLIVGAHFRPPAKQVLAVLPAGAKLTLVEDNENVYDPAAVRVLLPLDQIPESQYPTLDAELPNAGITLEQLMSTGPVFLGFVPAQDGKPLAGARSKGEPDLLGNVQVRELMPEVVSTLGFGIDGSPRLELETNP